MPKVKGPLFSLTASGTFRDILVFRSRAGEETTVARPARFNPTRSPAQEQQAGRFSDAVSGWRDLTTENKADWKAAASGSGINGYQLYLREYQLQGITPPAQPTLI